MHVVFGIRILYVQIGSSKWPFTLRFTPKMGKYDLFQKITEQWKSQLNSQSLWILIKSTKIFSCQVTELINAYMRSATIRLSSEVQNFDRKINKNWTKIQPWRNSPLFGTPAYSELRKLAKIILTTIITTCRLTQQGMMHHNYHII